MPHWIYIIFFFALGACVGSFLNVVVWRLPRIEHDPKRGLLYGFWESLKGLSDPPSHCPKCSHKLAWYDNIPVFGWIFLKGKCRYCGNPISPKYPIIEAICGGIFVLYYVLWFVVPPTPPYVCSPQDISRDWGMVALYLFVVGCLLASSLIDAELYIIPIEICYTMAVVGLIAHALFDEPGMPGNLLLSPTVLGLSIGATIGWIISLLLWSRGILSVSFPEGEPMLEVDREMMRAEQEKAERDGSKAPVMPIPPPYTPKEIRLEMRKEMAFLTPPLMGAAVGIYLAGFVPGAKGLFDQLAGMNWLNGFFGAMLGAMVGAFTIWLTRILGTIGFGRVAMGLGDVHLMFGVGACLGAGISVMAFFISPFFGILIAIYLRLTQKKHEMPYGPYLSLASAFLMIFYCPLADHVRPGLEGLLIFIQEMIGGA